jgi:Tol biopolymer transport system component
MEKRTIPFLSFLFAWVLMMSGCVVNTSPVATTGPSASANGTPTLVILPPGFGPNSTLVPMTWADLKLSGKLLFVASVTDGTNNYNNIQLLDLATGKNKTVFQSVPDGWIDSAVVSPDGSLIVMGYSTPDLQAGAQFTPLGLYSVPMDGTQSPQQVVPLPLKDDQFIEPVWSPDGKYIYYVLANYGIPPVEANQHYPIFQIFRMTFPNGQPEKLIDKAYWPRLSPDGTKLAYVSENPDDGTNKLFISNIDGSNPRQIPFIGAFQPNIMDVPLFLPDGKTLLFSSPTPATPSISWIDWLFGVIPASAHNLASDWFTVPLSGGVANQITHVQIAGLYAALSPDKQYIASFSGDGVFVMKLDGSNLTQIIGNLGGNPGTVNWIP